VFKKNSEKLENIIEQQTINFQRGRYKNENNISNWNRE
jgi:hypothetical protein